MRYHPEDFMALSSAVLDEGGRLLEDECVGKIIKDLKSPDADGKLQYRRAHTAHCNQAARMDIAYDPFEPVLVLDDNDESIIVVADKPERPTLKIGEKEPEHFARVCAVDDAVGLWPRYADVVTDRSFLR